MSLLWIYFALLLLIFAIEYYKATSISKNEEDFIFESWEEYNVRVHSRVPKYHGPNPFKRRPNSFYETIKRIIMFPIALIRVLYFIFIVCLGAIISYPASKFRFQRKATSQLIRFFVRTILFVFGFYSIPIRNQNGWETDINKASRVIIANHHTIFDGFLLLYYTNGVVAATAELKKVPFFGNCLVALNTLFINRHGKDGRNRAKQQIIDHINNENLPPLIIFPQGTTSSIYTLTAFKVGAFLTGKPVLPVTMNWIYNKNWDCSYVGDYGMLHEMWCFGSQVINYVHLTIAKPYVPENKEDAQDAHKFAELARIEILKPIKSYCRMTPHSMTDHLLYDFAYAKQKMKLEISFALSDVAKTLKFRTKTIQYLAKKFNDLDLNGNGYIEYTEFCKAFNRDPVKHVDKMSKLFQLFCVNKNFNKIGFDEFLNGVSICFVDSMINDAIRVMFDGCSRDNKYIKQQEILAVYNKQIDKSRFENDSEYNKYFDKMQFFVNTLFNYNQIQQMDFNTFHKTVIDKQVGNFVQEFLQIIIMIRLKIKLRKEDFKQGDDDEDKVVMPKHPKMVRSDSIMSVAATDFGTTISNKM